MACTQTLVALLPEFQGTKPISRRCTNPDYTRGSRTVLRSRASREWFVTTRVVRGTTRVVEAGLKGQGGDDEHCSVILIGGVVAALLGIDAEQNRSRTLPSRSRRPAHRPTAPP
jgi:hypothetical protein